MNDTDVLTLCVFTLLALLGLYLKYGPHDGDDS